MKQMQKNEPREATECLSSIMLKSVNQLPQDEEEDKLSVRTSKYIQSNLF
jgi:hypothetical protein